VADGQSGGRETADGVADQPQIAQVLLQDYFLENIGQQSPRILRHAPSDWGRSDFDDGASEFVGNVAVSTSH
jgi:hypothetical protein